MNGFQKGDTVLVSGSPMRGTVLAADDALIIVKEHDGLSFYVRYDYGLGAWTLQGRKVEVEKVIEKDSE